MAKKPTFYRMTISLSADLKRRMDKATEPVTWSNVAAAAFEAKLGELASKKESKNMDDVIQRLRASKQQGEAQAYKDGFECGQDWAKQSAEADDLRRLEVYRDKCGHDWERVWELTQSPDSDLVQCINPEADRHEVEAFWEALLDDTALADNQEFVRGFAEGAIDVWEDVKDQL